MRVVVADATPLHYLILIDAVDVLPSLFKKIHVPIEIYDELTHEAAPPKVRGWMQQLPEWLVLLPVSTEDPSLAALDRGERSAIALAESLGADLLSIDDRAGAILAQREAWR